MRAFAHDQDLADYYADQRFENAKDRAHDPMESGPAQWRMAPSTGQAVVELDGETLRPQVPVSEAIAIVRWLNMGGLRDLQRPMAADIDTRDTAIAERDETIRELRERLATYDAVQPDYVIVETDGSEWRRYPSTTTEPQTAGHAGGEG